MTGPQAFLPGFDIRRLPVRGINIHTATAGQGPALLLLHGHPHTMIIWRKVAQAYVDAGFSVVITDLRGYGDSDKPESDPDHAAYSKREMAADQVAVMNALGHDQFAVIGHDRGGRVAHRMALDHPDAVTRLSVIDIAPTATMYAQTDMEFARRYFWWFFLIQDAPLPERMIEADPKFFLRTHIDVQLADRAAVDDAAFAEYLRAYLAPGTIHAICEDYRAAATIDLTHDAADADTRIAAPLQALWGGKGTVGALYDVLQTWRDKADHVEGRALPCGHCLQEELPQDFITETLAFLRKP